MQIATREGHVVECIGLTGQMHGCVMLDAAGEVLRPALIWCDQRTQPQCDWLTGKLGAAKLIELTCNPALPNFTLTKLLWVREHQPEIFARIAHVLCPKDYVRLRLTGEYAIDMQEASGTLLLDVTHRRWSAEVADAAGIPRAWLPKLFEGPEVCGRITSEAASLTGLSAGTPVVAGAGDQGAGAVGMGILEPGSVSATIGTSGVVFAATAVPTKDPLGRLHTFCHAAPGIWHVNGRDEWRRPQPSLPARHLRAGPQLRGVDGAGGRCACGLGGPAVDAVPLRRAHAAPRPECACGVPRHLPHRTRSAITCGPFWRAWRSASRTTFTLFAELGIPVERIRLGGGGARSPLWQQVQADVYNHAVELLEAEEGGAFGAALLAGTGVGAWPSVQAACAATVRSAKVVEPVAAEAMQRAYPHFRRMYSSTADVLKS